MEVTCVYTTKVFTDTSITTMENRDCLRRMARHEEPVFSNQSIMNVMEKFVKSVNNMDETILVPCRLMDLKVGDANDTVLVKSSLKHSNNKRPVQNITSTDTDLFNLYTIINAVKNELLWSQKCDHEADVAVTLPTAAAAAAAATSVPAAKPGHNRRPSSASLASTNSAASSISDTESDAGNENDSGIEAEENTAEAKDYTQQVADNFRRHLKGLYHSLEQMTEAATYLTTRYQNDVGGAV